MSAPPTLIINWLNTTVSVNVTYSALLNPKNTIFGQIKRCLKAFPGDFIYNDFLLGLGVGGMDNIYPVYVYEPRTGIFLYSNTLNYLDDIFTQKFGIIMTEPFKWSPDQSLFFLADMGFQGDLNSDWVVNILDLTVAAAFGTKPGDERWNQVADVNKDNAVNIVDIAMTAREFGIQYVTAD